MVEQARKPDGKFGKKKNFRGSTSIRLNNDIAQLGREEIERIVREYLQAHLDYKIKKK